MKLFAALAVLFGIAIAVGVIYYLAIKYNPWHFVFPQAARVLVLNNGIEDQALPRFSKALPGQFRGIRAVSARLKEVADEYPSLTHILTRLQKRVLLVETENNKSMLIADTGWQSFLLPGGGLAVRSIFNPEGKVRFSAQEERTAGIDYILYGITPTHEEAPFYLALFGNILLVAEEAETITASIQESQAHSAHTQETGTDWALLAGAFPLENISLLFAPKKDPLFLPGRSELSLVERGSACSLHLDSRDSIKISLCVFFASASGEGQGAGRVLRSNQYRATTLRTLTEETECRTTLLFDDIEELVRLVSDMGARRYEITEDERSELHDWAANELSFFSWKGKDFISIRAQDARRALVSARKASADNTEIETKDAELNAAGFNLLKTPIPGFMKVFMPFAPNAARLGSCVQKNNEFIFGESAEALKALITSWNNARESVLPKDVSGFFGEKANLLDYRKGASPLFPAGIHIAEAVGLDRARLFTLSRIRVSTGRFQAEIHMGQR